MGSEHRHVVRLEFTSAFEMLDLVQMVGDHVGPTARAGRRRRSTGSASRSASRSSTPSSTATRTTPASTSSWSSSAPARGRAPSSPSASAIRAPGSTPTLLADPLAPENLLKSSGRGIFLIRSFMDDVQLRQRARRRHGDPHDQARRRPPAPPAIRQRLSGLRSAAISPRRSRRSSAPAIS